MFPRRSLLATLAILATAGAGYGQSFDRQSLLTRTALGRLGLEKHWSTVVPLGPTGERVLNVSVTNGMLFAQTSGGMLHAYDDESGRYLWNTALEKGTIRAFPAAVQDNLVIVTAGQSIFGLDRGTGRQIWRGKIEGLPATGVVTDKEYAVVGQRSGKLAAYALVDRSHLDPPGRSAGAFAWAIQSGGPVTAQPIITPHVITFGSHDGRVYTSVIPDYTHYRVDPLYRFRTGGPINAPLIGFGERTLIVPSEDNKLYAIDLFNGRPKWSVATGDPIDERALVGGDQVYALNVKGRLFSISGATGAVTWDSETGANQILSISPTRLYLSTPNEDLVIVDRATGKILASARDTLERSGLDTRLFTLNVPNAENDRCFMASPNGMIYCLREIGRLQPALLRDPNLPPFGYIPPTGLHDEQQVPMIPAPEGAPAPPADAAEAPEADNENR